jgi:hypothetical protein
MNAITNFETLMDLNSRKDPSEEVRETRARRGGPGLIPVLYERAIEWAARERWAVIWGAVEKRLAVLKLPYVDFGSTTGESGALTMDLRTERA